jgi:hypothetical protein
MFGVILCPQKKPTFRHLQKYLIHAGPKKFQNFGVPKPFGRKNPKTPKKNWENKAQKIPKSGQPKIIWEKKPKNFQIQVPQKYLGQIFPNFPKFPKFPQNLGQAQNFGLLSQNFP